jgi:hypothetical protein
MIWIKFGVGGKAGWGGFIVGMVLSIMCRMQAMGFLYMEMSRIDAAKRKISVKRSLRKQA